MSMLNFTESEPVMKRGKAAESELQAGNAAFYQRLQGQTKRKTGIERFGWVALPVAAVAIIGVVALTSTPHETAKDVVGAPGQTAAATPAAATQVASNDAN